MRHGLSIYRRPEFPTFFRMMNEIDDLFHSWPEGARNDQETGGVAFAPEVDIEETEKHYLLSFDLPGLSEKDLTLTVTDRQLTVSGERKREFESKDKKSHRVERSFGRFERTFTLPETVNSEQIEAKFKDGVLEVQIPKMEKAVPKTVNIKVN